MSVLYTFTPTAKGDWTGTYEDSSFLPNGYTEISDTFDYHFVDNVGTYGAAWSAAYKHVARSGGNLIRFKGSIGITDLPDNTASDSLHILQIGWSDDINAQWDDWGLHTRVGIRSDGKLTLGYGNSTHKATSSNAISAGTTYDIELVADMSGTPVTNLYVDGDLWLTAGSEVNYGDFTAHAYVAFHEAMLQYGSGCWYGSTADVTLHVDEDGDGNHVWTIEGGPLSRPFWMVY